MKPKYNVKIGWYYDEAMMSPKSLLAMDNLLHSVSGWALSKPSDHGVEIVNLDTPMDDRSPTAHDVTTLGLSINGKLIKAGNPGTDYTVNDITAALFSCK